MFKFLNTLKFAGLVGLFYFLLMVEVFLLILFPEYRVVMCVVGAVFLAMNYTTITSRLKSGFGILRSRVSDIF